MRKYLAHNSPGLFKGQFRSNKQMLVKHQTSSGISNEDREAEVVTEEARTITELDEEETKEHESTLPRRKGKTVIFDDEKSMISSR